MSKSSDPTPVPEPDDQTPDVPEVDQGEDEGEPGGHEAAKLRKRAQAAETERDTLTARVQAMQRAEVERHAAATLAKPAGLWVSGVDLAELLDDSGDVDPAKVREAATTAADQLGLGRTRPGNYVPREGTIAPPSGKPGWSDALKET